MLTYTWHVLSLYTKPSLNDLTDVVRRITWRYQLTDGGNYGEIYKDTYLPEPSDTNTYIAYSDLSEETIIGWIQSIEDIPALQAELQIKLEKSKNPDLLENKLPWIFEDRYKPREDKYAMVFNGEVVYGPVHWHSDGMNAALESCGYPRSMPDDILVFRKGIVPYDKPLIVSDNLKIYKVQLINDQPPENPFYDNGHIVWDLSGDIAIGTYESVPKSLALAKGHVEASILGWVQSLTDVAVKVNINNVDHWFWAQLPYRLELMYRFNTMDDNATFQFKTGGNAWVELNKSNLVTILAALEERVQYITVWERDKMALKDQAFTIDELVNVYDTVSSELLAWLNANDPRSPYYQG